MNSNSPFEINYIGASVSGQYFTDRFSIGGMGIIDYQMAYVDNVDGFSNGILGINGLQQPYSLPNMLRDQGRTNTATYSIYLDSIDSATGSILFGGWDTAKFEGELTVLPWDLALT